MPKVLLQNFIVKTLKNLKAEDVVLLKIQKKSSIADFMIVCTGKSSRQLASTADHLLDALREKGVKSLSVKGKDGTGWVLIDLGYIIVHIMTPETRAFFALEDLWK